ncbi:MAG: DM13 domain-containing protein [Lewinellaceae bacterium]|nr:DM13 domain-containing protein [Lewinellaceae bacterium]
MGYSVKGTATLQQSGLNLTLQLGGDFAASNGPMLGVYLAKTASGGLNAQNSLQLALLSANAGAQEYSVPAGTWLHDYDYVVIYCIPFNVRFGTAKLNG